jgi:hypothetical protein
MLFAVENNVAVSCEEIGILIFGQVLFLVLFIFPLSL